MNIVNNFNNNSPEEGELECDVQIDDSIFNDPTLTEIINQVLDDHKICDIARLLKVKFDLFVYDENWYYFNGYRWIGSVKGILEFKRKILIFYKDHPLTETLTKLRKNVKSLIKSIFIEL
jgi:hypothetical protein